MYRKYIGVSNNGAYARVRVRKLYDLLQTRKVGQMASTHSLVAVFEKHYPKGATEVIGHMDTIYVKFDYQGNRLRRLEERIREAESLTIRLNPGFFSRLKNIVPYFWLPHAEIGPAERLRMKAKKIILRSLRSQLPPKGRMEVSYSNNYTFHQIGNSSIAKSLLCDLQDTRFWYLYSGDEPLVMHQ